MSFISKKMINDFKFFQEEKQAQSRKETNVFDTCNNVDLSQNYFSRVVREEVKFQ